ncbi:MAG: glycosyltransferase family 4 protein [Steroidobacteraceae bacterium]
MKKPEILFVEQYYYPEGGGGAQIPRDITISWADFGWRVAVLCGSEQYASSEDDSMEDPRSHGVAIRKVRRLPGGDVRKARMLRQLWFCVAIAPRLLFSRCPQAFVAQTNPPIAVVLVALAAMLRRRPLIVIAQDLYPEVLFAHGMLNAHTGPALVLSAAFRWAYRRASAVVSLGPRMTERLIEKGVANNRIWKISNWATGDLPIMRGDANALLREWGLREKFVLVYSGNFGVAHDCATLLGGFARASKLIPELRLVIIGAGIRIAEARHWVERLGLEEWVAFKPSVPFSRLPQTFGIADLGVVTLLPGFDGLVVPSKLLGNMARGIPTLYVGPVGSDVDIYIRESGGGLTVVNGDIDGFARSVAEIAKHPEQLREMGLAAQRYYSKFLSRDIGIAHYGRLLSTVTRAVESH